MQFIDIHTHRFSQNEEVIAVKSISLGHDDLPNLQQNQPLAVGLHPWYAKLENLDEQLAILTQIAKEDKVCFIGECGLDSLRGEKMSNQLEVLEAQILLAQELQKPVILHCVKAFDELVALKKKLNVTIPMVVHGFNKSEQLGQQLLNLGFQLSFGKSILNPNSGAAKLLTQIPHFFLETDDSDVEIEEIYTAAANLKKCSIDQLKARIFADCKNLKIF